MAAPFTVTFAEGSDLTTRKILMLLVRLGTVIYFFPQLAVGYICWYRLSAVPLLGQPIVTLPLPQKTAMRLQPDPLFSERMREPVRSTPLFPETVPSTL